MRSFFLLSSLLLFSGCSQPSVWMVDAMAAGDPLFDSTRLQYKSPLPDAPLSLELIRSEGEVFAFLNLRQFTFRPSSSREKAVEAKVTLGESTIEAKLPLLEGNMKARLPSFLLDAIVEALQEGLPVKVSLDGFEETFLPRQFKESFEAWLQSPEKKIPVKGMA